MPVPLPVKTLDRHRLTRQAPIHRLHDDLHRLLRRTPPITPAGSVELAASRYFAGTPTSRMRQRTRFASATASLGERSWPWSKNLLREERSSEQVSGYLRRSGELLISHETIYRQVSCGSVRA